MFFTMPKNPMGWNSAPFENPSRRVRLKVSKRYISSCTRYFLLRRTHRTDVTLIVLYKINFDHKSRRKIWKKIVKILDNLVWCLRFTTYRKMHTINRLDGPYSRARSRVVVDFFRYPWTREISYSADWSFNGRLHPRWRCSQTFDRFGCAQSSKWTRELA